MLFAVANRLCAPVSDALDRPTSSRQTVQAESRLLLEPAPRARRWGIVLGGGDGTRLQGLTRIITGDDRPKQFCQIFDSETLLRQAVKRASRSIAPERTIVALTRAHSRYYDHDLADQDCRKLIQPCNRGTAPAIILSLLQIFRMDIDAIVAILPSDHYYSDEAGITQAIESAFEIASDRPSSAVLIGAQARAPEVEFGWIELGSASGDELFRVSSFHEKPSLDSARRLMACGALWNTFVVVSSAKTLIDMCLMCLPDLLLRPADEVLESDGGTIEVADSLYEEIPSTDFSRKVLSPSAQKLLALRLNGVEWHDLGQPDRVVSAVRSIGKKPPAWMHVWEAAKGSPSPATSAA